MPTENTAGKLILSKLGMFNEAVVLFENTIEPSLLEGFDRVIGDFADKYNWAGEFDLHGENYSCWLAPENWGVAKPENDLVYKASFEMDYIHGDDDYWAALFCNQGVDGGQAGFKFVVKPNREKGGKKAWNAYAKEIGHASIAELASLGFKNLGGGVFFLPILLDEDILASTWDASGKFSHDDDAFNPLTDGLEKLKTAEKIFTQILNAAPL